MVVVAAGCQGSAALEEIPAGTEVAIELEDGRQVVGKLVEVEPEAVAVEGGGSGHVRVERADIAGVQSGDAAREAATRQIVVPAGTALEARLDTTIASQTSRVEDVVRATLTAPLVIEGADVAPAGSELFGTVTGAREAGRVKGRAELGIQFEQLRAGTVTYDIRTAPLRWVAAATTGEDAAKVGIGAAVGAVVGGITGGGKGAAVGSAVGAGGGSAVVLATRGEEIEVGAGSPLRVELTSRLDATVPAGE
jgi:hypothetical protein